MTSLPRPLITAFIRKSSSLLPPPEYRRGVPRDSSYPLLPPSLTESAIIGRQAGILTLLCLTPRHELIIVPMRFYAELARSCPKPSPEQFGGLVRRSKSRESVRPWHTRPTPRIGGLARDNFESFPFRCRDRTARSRWLFLMSGRSWLQPPAYRQDNQSAWQ